LTADPNRRARAAIAALLFLLPAGSALLHVADAASGTNVVTDPAGDNTGGGPQADVLRVGASNDASKLYFYVEVGSTSPPAADVEYQVDFTAPGQPPSARQYSIVATYSASGSMGPATLDFLTDVTGSSARTEQASIVGDEIVFAMSRADVSSPPTGATFTAIDALTYPPADPTTTWDDTSSGSYTMAAPTPATPSAPSITGAAGSPSSVALSWSAPASSGSSSVTGYKVYRGTTSGGETLLATLGNVLSYADSAVSAGQTYFYQVSAVNSAGEGPRSAEASATVAAPTLPGAVQGLSATAGDGKATLSWSAPASDGGSPITAYQVFQGSAPGAEGPTAVATVAGASATLTGLANGQTYYFRVRAQNAVGLGPEGSEVTVTPSLADAPTAFEDYHNTLGDTSSAGEPSLGVDQETGAVLYTSGFNTYKITNLRPNADARTPGAATWADVSNVKFAPTVLGDPIGWLDRHTNRFFQAELLVPPDCSQMGYTDDGGATWNVSDGSCNTPNGEDHETVGGGPFHGEKGPQLGSAYPDSVYYCTQANALATCAVSEDGGVTFQPARVIYHTILNQNTIATADGADPSGFCFNLHGHVKVSPTGIAAVPNKNCYTTGSQETKGGVTTSDDGNTWRIFSIPSSTQDPNGGDDDPSLDWSQSRAPGATHDRLWYGYYDGDHHMKIAHSDDLGATWSPSFDVGASLGLVNTKFPEVVAGDWDRAAIAFLGSATAGDNQASGFNGVWHLYVATTYDGGQTWTTVKASTDPVQKGCISMGGTTSSTCRNLLDFMDAQLDATGHVAVAYPDGCEGACAADENPHAWSSSYSNDAAPALAYQSGGRGLLSAFDTSKTVPAAPVIMASAGNGLVRLQWAPPNDGNSPITGYLVERDGSLLATLGAVASFEDRSVANGATYGYQVAAINSVGTGALSAPVSATPFFDDQAPTQVTDLQASAAADHAISLLWDASSDDHGVDHYDIIRDGAVVASVSSATTAFADSGLQNGRAYGYRVVAVDASGNAAPESDAVTAKPVRTLSAALVAADGTGDATGGAPASADLQGAGLGYDGSNLRVEWPIADLAAAPTTIRHDMAFTINSQNYVFEYERGGTRCNLYTQTSAAGFDPVANANPYTCGVDAARGVVWGLVPNAALRNVLVAGAQVTGVSADTCMLDTSSGGVTGLSCYSPPRGDRAPDAGSATYVVGTPNSAGHVVMGGLGDQAGAEGSLVSFQVPATSPEGDKVAFSATGLPAGATLDPDTGAFSWTPTFAQAGRYPVTLTADDGAASATKAINLTIANVDRAPVLDAVADQTVAGGSSLALALHATDADGDALTYGGANLPPGATVDAATGAFRFAPPAHAAASYPGVVLSAFDGEKYGNQTFDIMVTDVETAPALDAIADQTVAEGGSIAFQARATDAEGDALAYAIEGAPEGASFDPQTGAFSYAAPFATGHDSPAYALRVTVSDGEQSAERDLTLTVADVDRAPAFGPLENVKVNETEPISFPVSATDADLDAVTLSADSLPEGATFDDGQFSWTPTFDQSGNYPVAFHASDGIATTTRTVILTVGAVDRAPIFDATPDQAGAEGSLLSFAVHAADPDGDAVAYHATGLPQGATLDAQTGAFSWTPGFTQAGSYAVTFTASDSQLSVNETVALAIADVDRAPVVAPPQAVNVLEGTPIQLVVHAADPDGTAVALSAAGLPEGATFADHGDGTGSFAWTPAPGAHGAYAPSFTATSNGLSGSATLGLTVRFRANFTVDATDPTTIHASPGQAVDLDAVVTNLGVEPDSFSFGLAQTQAWGGAAPATTNLAAGESRHVTVHLVAPASGTLDRVNLTVSSLGQPGASKTASWTADVPLVLSVRLDSASLHPWQRPAGVVRATHLDGSPAAGVAVTLAQASDALALAASTLSGHADANGLWFFDFGSDAMARAPGSHTLAATAGLAGVAPTRVATAYTVG